jgi:transmembrane sensor
MFVVQEDDENKRACEAALIFILCKDKPRLSEQEQEWINDWIRKSPENVACLFEMIDVAQRLDRCKLADRAARLSSAPPPPPGFAFGRRTVLMGGAAAIALSVGALSFVALQDREPPIQHMTLADGSVLHALRGSDFSVEFSADARLISLRRGEIVAEVAHDSSRPFIVRSKTSDTIAVGTRFGVIANSTETITTVSEGEVRVVTPAGEDRTTDTAVRAGEELHVVAGASGPEPVLAVRAERKISWAAGWLEFEGESAGDAVKAFNRFVDVRIEITQPELSSARLTYGRFQFDRPESFAATLGAALDAPVTRNPRRDVIYIGHRLH